MLAVFAGFIHILGDAIETLSSECLGWPDYPWALMMATFAALITFTFEWNLHQYYTGAYAADQANCCAEGSTVVNPDLTPTHVVSIAVPVKIKTKDVDTDELERISYSVQSCTLEAGIIFHSIFIGISLGLTTDKPALQSLMIALMFHQFNEGLAIGLTFNQAQYSTLRYWLLGATFLLTTPIGVAIGIIVGHGGYSNSTLLATEGVFNSIGAGILLYNGLVDLIVPTFSVLNASHSSMFRFFGFVALFMGAGVMSLIGKWA